MVKVTAEKLS